MRAELAIKFICAARLPRLSGASIPNVRSKAPHANFFFQLKHAGNSTQAGQPCRTLSTPIQLRSHIGTERSPALTGPAAPYELYREFRTNRRPLNVASVVSRTVRAGKFIYGGRRPPRPEEHLSSKNCRSIKSEVTGVLYREIQKKLKIHYIISLTLGN